MRDILSRVATIAITVSILVVTAVIAKKEFWPAAGTRLPEPRRVENWQDVASGTHLIGRPDAPVKVIEFVDFQCPACASMAWRLRRIQESAPDRVAIVLRHFPLQSIHPHAFAAALALECAASQRKFDAFHDLLFAWQDSIGQRPWAALAASVGVPDVARFRECMEQEEYRSEIERDVNLGRRIGVRGTPTLVINGWMLGGVPSEAELERWLRTFAGYDQ